MIQHVIDKRVNCLFKVKRMRFSETNVYNQAMENSRQSKHKVYNQKDKLITAKLLKVKIFLNKD